MNFILYEHIQIVKRKIYLLTEELSLEKNKIEGFQIAELGSSFNVSKDAQQFQIFYFQRKKYIQRILKPFDFKIQLKIQPTGIIFECN